LPGALGTFALERQVTLVPEVELEHSGVILRTARGNRACGGIVDDEAWVTIGCGVIRRIVRPAADPALRQPQRRRHAGIGPRHTRNGNTDRLDAPHIVAGEVEVVELLR